MLEVNPYKLSTETSTKKKKEDFSVQAFPLSLLMQDCDTRLENGLYCGVDNKKHNESKNLLPHSEEHDCTAEVKIRMTVILGKVQFFLS